jgi:hypothetical protein
MFSRILKQSLKRKNLVSPSQFNLSYKVSALEIKELREMSGSGIQDCRTALTAHSGDMKLSMAMLKEKGLASAKKR